MELIRSSQIDLHENRPCHFYSGRADNSCVFSDLVPCIAKAEYQHSWHLGCSRSGL